MRRNLEFNAGSERQSTQFGLSQTGTEWLTKICLKANKGQRYQHQTTQTSMPEPGFEPGTLRTTVERLPATPRGPALPLFKPQKSKQIFRVLGWASLSHNLALR